MSELELAADAGGSAMAVATGVPYESGVETDAPTSLPDQVEAEAAEPQPEEAEPAAEDHTSADHAAASANDKQPEAADEPHLQAALEQHAALKQAVDADPELKQKLGQAFQRSAELEEFHQVFPSLDHARTAADHAAALNSFDALYFNETPEAPVRLLERLMDNQYLRDPESGDFLTDEQGKRISSGAYDRLTGAYRQILFETLAKQAAAAGDRELTDAVAVLRQRTGGNAAKGGEQRAESKAAPKDGTTTTPTSTEPELPADVKARLQRLEEMERNQAEQDRTSWNDYYRSVGQAIEQAVRQDIEQAMGQAALPAYMRGKLVDDVLAELHRQAADDATYQNRVQSLMRASSRTDAARQRMVAAARSHARARIAPVTQRLLNQAMSDLRQEQEARGARVREQQKRVEVKSAGAAPPPVRRSDGERIRGMEQKLGRRLSDREILDL